MPSALTALAITAALTATLYHCIIYPLFISPLSRIPGPRLYTLTRWRLAWEDWTGRRTRTIHALHALYGPVIRIGPNEVHFNSLSALRTIYGPGSGFGRTDFYRMFDVYGQQNLFTFHTSAAHAARKKLLAHAYSKSAIVRGPVAAMIESKISDFLALLSSSSSSSSTTTTAERSDAIPLEIFTALHYYSLDTITAFLYGTTTTTTTTTTNSSNSSSSNNNNSNKSSLSSASSSSFSAATTTLRNTIPAHRALLADILDPARRRLTWFAVHLPAWTRWLYSRTGALAALVAPLLPMRRPATYTGIRAHALRAVQEYARAGAGAGVGMGEDCSILARLWERRRRKGKGEGNGDDGMSDLEIASECADHLLAGIDTTSDTLMFLIWALSRPENAGVQERLVAECRALGEEGVGAAGVVSVEAADRSVLLEALVKETLRLFAPLPASEPRCCAVDAVVDGFEIPRGTVCAMAPYSLHRKEEVFPQPDKWDPDRWLTADADRLAEMKKWWWAFSSGGRMCIGMHLALAEMALVPAIYRKYSTRVKPGFENVSPGITSRFEVFGDDTLPKMEEHTCWVEFTPHES